MLRQSIKIGRYLLFTLLSNAIYGLVLYCLYRWLAGYSLLVAYLGNLVLMLTVLAIDEHVLKTTLSDQFVARMKKEKDPEKSYRSIQWSLENFGSFKTDLYVFYIFVLIASQILELNPALAGGVFASFILANSYSILFLIAVDTLIGQFVKDRERMRIISEKLKKVLTEDQD